MGQAEHAVENYLRKEIKRLGGRCFKLVPNFKKGLPDRVCCIPLVGTFFVETKTLSGETSKLQEKTYEEIKESGGIVFEARGKEGINELVTLLEKAIRDFKNG